MCRMAASPEFANTVQEAIRVYHKERLPAFSPESFSKEILTGWVIEKNYVWLSREEFETEFRQKPEDLGLLVEHLAIGTSRPVPGVLIRDETEKGVKVKGYWACQGNFTTELFSPSAQYRAGQGREVSEWDQAQQVRGIPKALLEPKCHKKGPTLQEIPALVTKFLEEKRLNEERQKAEAELLANPVETSEKPRLEENGAEAADNQDGSDEYGGEDDDEDLVVEHVPDNVMNGKGLAGKGGKKGSKGKGKGKKRGKKGGSKSKIGSPKKAAPASLASLRGGGGRAAPSVASQNDAVSVAGSVASKKSRHAGLDLVSDASKASPAEKAAARAREYLNTIDVKEMLEGKAFGRDLFSAQQSLEAMEKKFGASAETITLRAHLELATLAKERCG